MTLREKIRLEDIPITWNTNLSDDDIRSFYLVLVVDPDYSHHTEKQEPRQQRPFFSISISCFSKIIEFKDGYCQCYGFMDSVWAIYRTTSEWKLWEAHKKELQELRNEQADERQAELEIAKSQIAYHTKKGGGLLTAGQYDEAYMHLCARVDIMRENKLWLDRASENMWVSGFPVEYCIKYLNSYGRTAERYVDLAEAIDFWRRGIRVRDADLLLTAGMGRFPSDGRYFKRICLFWERRKDYTRAVTCCRVAVLRQLRDDTKLGFPHRLKRLQNKLNREALASGEAIETGKTEEDAEQRGGTVR